MADLETVKELTPPHQRIGGRNYDRRTTDIGGPLVAVVLSGNYSSNSPVVKVTRLQAMRQDAAASSASALLL